MVAIENLSKNYWFKTCSIRYTLYAESVSENGQLSIKIIETEPCTAEHFSKFPNFDSRNSEDWLCFPLKQNFSFFGFDAKAS